MRKKITEFFLELDINNEPRLIMIDEDGTEWAVTETTSSVAPGASFLTEIVRKDKCFYFKESNRIKPRVEAF